MSESLSDQIVLPAGNVNPVTATYEPPRNMNHNAASDIWAVLKS